jgi:hypothetical protein
MPIDISLRFILTLQTTGFKTAQFRRATGAGLLLRTAEAHCVRRLTMGPANRFCAALLLIGLCLSQPASAASLGAGEQAFARREYLRSASILLPLAEQGVAAAQAYVGDMYANGRGLPQNFFEAARWLRRAADQGEPSGQFLLGRSYDRGLGVKQDFLEAEMWFILAAARARPKELDYWTRMRDAVASKLTRAEIAEAQKRALEWAPVLER